ncbi:MAG: hypothetical protein JNM07_02330 [Phycisphaerae bacterium]|nr:hypothetical protein [Phycisphaerae bacterium]
MAPGLAVPAARQAKNVAVITIHGPIDAVTSMSVQRRIKEAAAAKADAIVFELDTPGGEVGAALEICGAIKRSPVPNTVAWVNPDAYSAGALIALACREVVVNEASTLGDALPVKLSFIGMINAMPEAERQKFTAPLLAEVVDSARRHGYDEKLVQGMVSRGVELWWVEKQGTGERLFIDRAEYRMLFGNDPGPSSPRIVSASGQPGPAAPSSPPEPASPPSGGATAESGRGTSGGSDDRGFVPASPSMPSKLQGQVSMALDAPSQRPVLSAADAGSWKLIEYVADGRGLVTLRDGDLIRYGLAAQRVRTDEELKVFFGATNVSRLDRSWSEAMVGFMTNPIVRGVLIVVFLVAMFLEMTHPGLMLPGTVAAVALVALVAPPLLVGMAAWWEVAAIVLGILLLGLEVFVLPGFGFFGVLGVVLLFGGLVGTFVPQGSGGLFPDTPKARSDLLFGIGTILVSAATSGVIMWSLGKHLDSLPMFNRLVLKSPSGGDEDGLDEGGGLLAAMGEAESAARIGDLGTALTPLRPAGKMEVGGRVVDVVSDLGFIEAGARLRVVSVEGPRIAVEDAGRARA